MALEAWSAWGPRAGFFRWKPDNRAAPVLRTSTSENPSVLPAFDNANSAKARHSELHCGIRISGRLFLVTGLRSSSQRTCFNLYYINE